MKEKFLVWFPYEYYFFGIAKYLADIYDCELFGITDVRKKEKQFFERQKFVNFKKIWYYRDEIRIEKSKKPDLNFLESFEKRTGINLWNIAYCDKEFYKFNPYYDYSFDEILSIIEQECLFFEKIIDETKPDYLLIGPTDAQHNYLLAKIAESKKITVLLLGPGRFKSQIIFFGDSDSMSTILSPSEPSSDLDTEYSLEKFLEKNDASKMISEYKDKLSTMNNLSKRLKRFYKLFSLLGDDSFRNHYFYYYMTRTKFLKTRLLLNLQRRYTNSFVENNLEKNWNEEEIPFIYYPLHSQPERAISIASPYCTNQVEIITHIAKSLPVNYQLFVKDHPIMDLKGGRNISFYKQIMKLPNVKLLHHNTNREKLLKGCSLVITITGTTGLEAAFYNKPTITFGKTPYSKLSWVSRVFDLEELPKIIRHALESKVDKNELRKYLSYMDYNSFNVDLNSIIASFSVHFRYNDINEKNFKEALDENKSEFQKLAKAYVKKIQEIKNTKNHNLKNY